MTTNHSSNLDVKNQSEGSEEESSDKDNMDTSDMETSDQDKMEESDKEKSSSDEESPSSLDLSDKEESEEESSDQEASDEETSCDEKSPLSIKVLSWNIDGINDAGFSRIRPVLVTCVVKRTNPDVILLQEIQPRNTPAIINKFFKLVNIRYKEAVGKGKKVIEKVTESQVLYNSSKYEQVDETEKLFPIDHDVDKQSLSVILDQAKGEVFTATSDKLREGAFEELEKVFDERISIVGLRIKHWKEGPIMIFLSFHNVHNVAYYGADIRARAVEGFCQLVTELRNLTGCVVLAGADLNQQLIEPYPYPTILDYTPTPRRLHSGQIDYFILEPVDCLRGQVEPWNFIEPIKYGDLNHLIIRVRVYGKKEEPPSNSS